MIFIQRAQLTSWKRNNHCQIKVTLNYNKQQQHVCVCDFSGGWHYPIILVKYDAKDERLMSPQDGALLEKRKPDMYNGFQYLLRLGLG